MLNELFTGTVPHGTDYRSIASMSALSAYLDQIVSIMIRQNPAERPPSIAAVKNEIQKYHAEAVSLQKLRELDKVVIPSGEVSDPLAHRPPKLIAAKWSDDTLTLPLDQPVHDDWVQSLYHMGNYTSVMGIGPEAFRFRGAAAFVSVQENSAQDIIDYFKDWLPKASALLKYTLEQQARREESERIGRLRLERAAEEKRLAVNRTLRI